MKLVTQEYILKATVKHSTIPREIMEESLKSYTPPFVDGGNGQVVTGISLDEQDRLLPNLIGTSLTNNEYRDRVRDYFADFTIYIPKDGLSLNGSYTTNAEGLELPVNVGDYILIKMLQADNNCSKAPETDAIYFFDYVLEDKQENKEREDNAFKLEMQASTELVKLFNSEGEESVSKLRTLVTVLKDVVNLSLSDVIVLDEIGLKKVLTEIRTKDAGKFLKESVNTELEKKATIIQAIELGVISLVGEEYYFESVKLGKSISVVIKTLKGSTEIHAKLLSASAKRIKELKN